MPQVPLHYTFLITETANPTTPIVMTATIDAFVDVFGAQVSPAGGTVTGNPTFTWSGTIPQEYAYVVELTKVGGGFYWNSGELPASVHSINYSGPGLAAGDYAWNLMVRDMFGNFSMVISPSFTIEAAILKGDLDGIDGVNLADAVIAMKAISGFMPTVRTGYATSGADVNNDGKVGLQELLYILQVLAGLRQ
jgi:hypothetical protein